MSLEHTGKLALHYVNMHRFDMNPEDAFRQQADALHRFVVCLQAKLRMTVEGRKAAEYELNPGELVYVPVGCSFALRLSDGTSPRAAIVSFQAEGEGAQSLTKPNRPLVFRMPQIRKWLAGLPLTGRGRDLTDYCRMQSQLYAMVSSYLDAAPKKNGSDPELARYVLLARRRMLERFDLTLEIDSIARSSGSSRFYRAFREHTGLSPHQFLTKTRLQASLRLLAEPGVSVTEAAHSVGYSDEYYFSRLFKKRMGLAPTEFAAKARTRAAVLCGVFIGDLEAFGMTPCITLKRDWEEDAAGREHYLREIRQASPDVILTGPVSEELRLQLSAIAPVHEYEWYTYSWKKRLAQFGELFGLSGVAEQWLSDFESKSANARALLRERYADMPLLIAGVRENNFRVFGSQIKKLAHLLYDELGFRSPPIAADIGFMDFPSLHEVAALDSDHILLLIEYPMTEQDCEQLEEDWRRLKADGTPKHCFCIRLDETFNYNATMHEALVDQLVYHLYTQREDFQKCP